MNYTMQDGRSLGDIVYITDCSLNNMIQANHGIKNSNEYRQWLQHNATNLMQEFKRVGTDCKFCEKCKKPILPSS